MTRQPTCVAPDTTALELVLLFQAKRHRHLLVVERGRLVGVISDRDVRPCFAPSPVPTEQSLAQVTVRELMSTDLLTTSPSTPLDGALAKMIEHGISCLPVLAAEHLMGILTNTDVQVVTHLLLQSLRKSDVEHPCQTLGVCCYDHSSPS